MSEQVKEPSKTKRTFSLILNVLFLISMAFFLYTCFFVDKPRDEASSQKVIPQSKGIDFATMSKEDIATTVKTIDKHITGASISVYNDKKGELLLIDYNPKLFGEVLRESVMGMKNITQKIMAQDGAERFDGIGFYLELSTVDNKNNKHVTKGGNFLWSRDSLHGINWKGFTEEQFLNLIDVFDPEPIIHTPVLTYCSEKEHMQQLFCSRFVKLQ